MPKAISKDFRRIVIVGSWGAGKSTLAAQLGQILDQEVIYLDTLFWKPGWTATSDAEQDTIIQKLITRPSWVIEGDHPRSQDVRFPASDTIIFLDYPWTLCLQRALARSIRHWGKQRPGGPAGCLEYPRWRVLKWIWRYPRRRRPALLEKMASYAEGRNIVHLRTPAETAAFLQQLSSLS